MIGEVSVPAFKLVSMNVNVSRLEKEPPGETRKVANDPKLPHNYKKTVFIRGENFMTCETRLVARSSSLRKSPLKLSKSGQ